MHEVVILFAAMAMTGLAVGQRFGVLAGVAAALALYSLAPYRYTR